MDVSDFTAGVLGDGTDDSGEITAADLEAPADAGNARGAKDAHGRKPGHEHYGHDHQ